MPEEKFQNLTQEGNESIHTGSSAKEACKDQTSDICDTLAASEAYNTMKEFLNIIRKYGYSKEDYSNERSYNFDQNYLKDFINNLQKEGGDIQIFKNKLCENFRKSYMGWNHDWGNIVARFRNLLSAEAYQNPHQFTEKYGIKSNGILSNSLLEFQDKLTDDVLYKLIEHDIKGFADKKEKNIGSLYHLAMYYTELLKKTYSECLNNNK